MKIRIKAFAGIRDICGFDEKEVVVGDDITVGEVFERLAAGFGELKKYRKLVLFAVNEEYCDGERVLFEGDVVAIFPPVSGG